MPNDPPTDRDRVRKLAILYRAVLNNPNDLDVRDLKKECDKVAKQIGQHKFEPLWNEVKLEEERRKLEEERRKLEEERRNRPSRFASPWVTNLKPTFYPDRLVGAITRPGRSGTSTSRGAYKMFGQLGYRKRLSQAQAVAGMTSVPISMRREMWWIKLKH
jgi:hypothetical protein